MITRRLFSLGALAAPLVVRTPGLLMPVRRVLRPPPPAPDPMVIWSILQGGEDFTIDSSIGVISSLRPTAPGDRTVVVRATGPFGSLEHTLRIEAGARLGLPQESSWISGRSRA